MVKQIFKKLINIGVYPENSSSQNTKVKLLNSFCVALGVILFCFVFLDMYFANSFWNSMKLHLLNYICFILVFFLHKYKYYNIAVILFLLSVLFSTFVFSNFFQKGQLMENVYFSYSLVALILFDDKRFSISFLILSFLLYYIPSHYVFTDNYYDYKIMNPVTVLCVFIGNYIILNYSQTLNKINEKNLYEKQQELEDAYLELEKRKENELSGLKLESLRSQMNPHFIFNALNSIQDYIIRNQKTLAGDYLGKFADLIRLYLDQSSKQEISLAEEIDTLQRYLELEKLRFEDKLSCNLIVDSTIDLEAIFIPTMLIQPYVENSLKHGLLHKQNKGVLNVEFSINDTKDLITCIVTDDGIGREKSKLIHNRRTKKHHSFATRATKERLELYNYMKERSIQVTITDFDQDQVHGDVGTKVVITIPV